MPIENMGMQLRCTLRSLVQPLFCVVSKLIAKSFKTCEKQEMAVFCGLSTEQAELYQRVVSGEIESAEGLQRRGMILALVKLKQICNHPAQYLKQSHTGNATSLR